MKTVPSMDGINKIHFKHNHLESLVITVDNETMLRLYFDFTHGHHEEAYDTLMQSTGQYKGHRATLVNYHDFGNGSTILVFDLTSRGECDSEQFTVKILGNVHLQTHYLKQTTCCFMVNLMVF